MSCMNGNVCAECANLKELILHGWVVHGNDVVTFSNMI